jgi:hypothetical protein
MVARHVNGWGHVQLKSKLDALCTDIATHLDASEAAGDSLGASAEEVSYRAGAASQGWWPSSLGSPAAVGGQNELRYAVFPETCRLVIDDRGSISTYDTGDHQIFGVAQAQSSDRTISFTSQNGLVKVADLTKV